MYETIALIGEILLYSWPTKSNRALWKKFKLLKKQTWYRKLQNQHLNGFHLNDAVRAYVEQGDVEQLVQHPEMIETFTIGLKDILKRENF